MAQVNPFDEVRRHRARQGRNADTAAPRRNMDRVGRRRCVNPSCKEDMVVAASRGHRVLVCMSCMTSLPVTEDWQMTSDQPPPETAGQVLSPALDFHQAIGRKNVEVSESTAAIKGGDTLDISWLPSAAKKLNISPSIRDYAMVPVILFYGDVPNRNGLGFLTKDMTDWSTEYKMPRYKTWRGAPLHVEHDNADPSKAVGVVLDTSLRKHDADPVPFVKQVAYLAVDRKKDPEVAKRVLSREAHTYSMGAYINGGYVCSVCEKSSCGHIVAPTNRRKYISLIEGGNARDAGGATRRLIGQQPRIGE